MTRVLLLASVLAIGGCAREAPEVAAEANDSSALMFFWGGIEAPPVRVDTIWIDSVRVFRPEEPSE